MQMISEKKSEPFFNEASREVQLIDRAEKLYFAKAAQRVTFTSVTAVLRRNCFRF